MYSFINDHAFVNQVFGLTARVITVIISSVWIYRKGHYCQCISKCRFVIILLKVNEDSYLRTFKITAPVVESPLSHLFLYWWYHHIWSGRFWSWGALLSACPYMVIWFRRSNKDTVYAVGILHALIWTYVFFRSHTPVTCPNRLTIYTPRSFNPVVTGQKCSNSVDDIVKYISLKECPWFFNYHCSFSTRNRLTPTLKIFLQNVILVSRVVRSKYNILYESLVVQ